MKTVLSIYNYASLVLVICGVVMCSMLLVYLMVHWLVRASLGNRHVRFMNALNWHERILAKFLRKRGWVVFYLEKQHRTCDGMCWLKLYESENSND